jgi:hypothetical protein
LFLEPASGETRYRHFRLGKDGLRDHGACLTVQAPPSNVPGQSAIACEKLWEELGGKNWFGGTTHHTEKMLVIVGKMEFIVRRVAPPLAE